MRLHRFVFPIYGLPIVNRAFYGAGLTMYDLLGSARRVGRHHHLGRARTLELAPVLRHDGLRGSIVYHDGVEDDARFTVPVVRTALNPLAGAIGIPLPTFTLWQVIGGLVWAVGLTLAGYALGSRISNIDGYLLPIIALVVVVSLIPLGIELLRRRSSKAPSRRKRS